MTEIYPLVYGPQWKIKLLQTITRQFNTEDLKNVNIPLIKSIIDPMLEYHIYYYIDKQINIINFAISTRDVINGYNLINNSKVTMIKHDIKGSRCKLQLNGTSVNNVIPMDYHARSANYVPGVINKIKLALFANIIFDEKKLPLNTNIGLMLLRVLDIVICDDENTLLICLLSSSSFTKIDGPKISVIINSRTIKNYNNLEKGKIIWVNGMTSCVIVTDKPWYPYTTTMMKNFKYSIDNNLMTFNVGIHTVNLNELNSGIRHLGQSTDQLCLCDINTKIEEKHIFALNNGTPVLNFLSTYECMQLGRVCKSWFDKIWNRNTLNRAKSELIKYFTAPLPELRYSGNKTTEGSDEDVKYAINSLTHQSWNKNKIALWIDIINSRETYLRPYWTFHSAKLWGFTSRDLLSIPHYIRHGRCGVYFKSDLIEARKLLKYADEPIKIDSYEIRFYKYLPKFVKDKVKLRNVNNETYVCTEDNDISQVRKRVKR